MDKKKLELPVYIVLALALAWAVIYGLRGILGLTVAESLMMYVPLLSLLLVRRVWQKVPTGVAWRPRIKENWRWYLAALTMPVVLTVLGAALYFLVFPSHLDLSMRAVRETALQAGMDDTAITALLVAQLAFAVLGAPFINMVFAIGEEAGWRGFMYPALREKFGPVVGCLIGGAIWGVWHAPATLLGHNYGTGYPGFPFTGILCMCLFCFSFGTLLCALTQASGSIWPAALCHGSINAVASLAALVLRPDAPYSLLVGPLPMGVLAGVPALILALMLLARDAKRAKSGAPS